MMYLILAMISSMLVSVMMRVGEKHCRNSMSMLAANYLMCTVAAGVLAGLPMLPAGEGLPLALGTGAVSGVMYLAGFVLLKWNVSRNGVVLPSTFMKLGVVVPTLAAILLFGEAPRWTQLVGVVLAVAAIIAIGGKGEQSAGSLWGLILLMLSGGSADTMSKVFEAWGDPALKNHFLLYTFLTALVLCVILCVVKKQRLTWRDLGLGLALGVPNYMSARFLLWALAEVPAMVVFPTFSVGTIVLVTAAGALLFKEKLDRRKLVALGMILISLVLLNI